MSKQTLNNLESGLVHRTKINENFDELYVANHTHTNKTILDSIEAALTTALKTAYDSTVTWISTNGANILNHLTSTSNPHSVTKGQVGLSNVPNLDTTNAVSNSHIHSNQTILDNTTASFTTAQETKLGGIASGATVNDTDANLKNRANHTGTQTVSTISDFNESVEDIIGTKIIAGTNVTVSYNDTTGETTVSASNSGLTYQSINSDQSITYGNFYGVACSNSNINLTLSNGTVPGQILRIKKIDSTGRYVNILGNIDGETSISLSMEDESVDLFWNGSYYLIF